MLYKIEKEEDKYSKIEPVGYKDFSNFGKSEKDLENLIADNLLLTLFEDGNLMPLFQERPWQPEADIYALNSSGDLIILELKRSTAGAEALDQTLRYAQIASNWSYSKLDSKFKEYENTEECLQMAHQEAFDLEKPILERDFNKKQHLVIIGSAANDGLIKAIDYWKRNGVNIDFSPYRVYVINNNLYFEFFSKPYDIHINPSSAKGVIFDTNKTYDKDAIWKMFENDYVAAYGDARQVIHHVKKGDLVFLSHKHWGIIGACKVEGSVKKEDEYTWYRKVTFLTQKLSKEEPIKAMPFGKVREIMGKNFFWARTIKTPYLSKEEADLLLEKLKDYLEK